MNLPRRPRRFVLPVINLKGGTGKTTTAVFTAHALHERGHRVLLVDADPQGSATRWNQDALEPFPFPVVGMASRTMHKQLGDVAGDRFDVVVIDTPPLEEQSGIVTSTLRVATLALCPIAPTPMEYDRLPGVRRTVTDSADNRADALPVPLAVLLTRTVPLARSTEAYRMQIMHDGMWCLKANVGRLERFSQAFGSNVERATDTAYGDAVEEIMTREHMA